jgi:hypothetical protein
VEPDELLQKYNPLLVLLPQDPARHRPWSRWYEKIDQPRGDYHPCSAEFFLSFVLQRDRPRHWDPTSFLRPALPMPTGLPALQARVAATPPDATLPWELDVAPLRSQHASQSWTAYGLLLQQDDPSPAPHVYARYVAGARPVLTYWYLYVYNDAPNRHEGDWESVAIELNAAGEPLRAGYAGHASGFRRPWARVEKLGDRPVVYVARGSHAAYFEHRPNGHRTNSLRASKGWTEPFESAWQAFNRTVQDLMRFLRLVDRTPSRTAATPAAPDLGEVVDPSLVVLPEIEEARARPELWWTKLRCNWGSRHSRLQGTIGPQPPWEQEAKWNAPAVWLDGIVDD